MNTLAARTSALVLGAGGLFLATASEAEMSVAPLKRSYGAGGGGCGTFIVHTN